MKEHRYRITLEHLAGKKPDDNLHAPLQFECGNHDDVFAIIARLQEAALFDQEESAAFALGLKLFSEVMLHHRDHVLFEPLKESFGTFMKSLKAASAPQP